MFQQTYNQFFRVIFMLYFCIFYANIYAPVLAISPAPSGTGFRHIEDTINQNVLDQIFNNEEYKSLDISSKGEYRPCDQYTPQKPDFSAPGRRISLVKCYDYIWGIKIRADLNKRDRDCTLQKNKIWIDMITDYTLRGIYPHMAAIGWKGTHDNWFFKCAGTVISSKFVLTAAHCIEASTTDPDISDVTPKIIRIGFHMIYDLLEDELAIDSNITRIIRHPLYKTSEKYYDVALLELENEIEFTADGHPACLLPNIDLTNTNNKLFVTGWDETLVDSWDETLVDNDSSSRMLNLEAAEVGLIDSDNCNNLLPSGLQQNQMCVGNFSKGKDECQFQDDAGGPLQVDIPLPSLIYERIHNVVAIRSVAHNCTATSSPGVYTKVADILDWIENTVWQ